MFQKGKFCSSFWEKKQSLEFESEKFLHAFKPNYFR